MTTALQLTAQATIINGHGLQESANLISQISTFQAHPIVSLMANTYALASSSNSYAAIFASLSNICVGVSQGQWILDLYPSNITPVCSGTVSYYAVVQVPVLGNPHTVAGNVVYDIVGYTPNPLVSSASMSGTIGNQAALPFAYGLSGFANVFQTAQGFIQQGFETVGSIYMLKNKTYAQSGIGYTGPQDLATNGLRSNGALLANVISGWGTMYDIKNIATAGDPYVFGQNLLNQGFGSYGNLSSKLSAAGLNISNLSQVPQNSVVVSQAPANVTTSTPIGQVSLPTLANVSTSTVVKGGSTNVILSIYQSITGADLQNIVTATGTTISNASITTLADYLNFNKVVASTDYTSLSSQGITDFASFGPFLQSKVGSGSYSSWQSMSIMLGNINVPTLSYTTTSNTDVVLSSSTISTLLSATGTGSGPFNNLIMSDLLGAVTGDPYTPLFQTLNSSYDSLNTNKVYLAVKRLNNTILANINDPDITSIDSNVANVNTQLNSLSIPVAGQTAYYKMLNHLTSEVSNLGLAGVVFNSGYQTSLKSFAQSIGSTASDTTQYQTYQFFANLFTNDIYGDTIRSAVSEVINTRILGTNGVIVKNDPSPSSALFQSQQQNIPLSTYLSQNK